MVELARKRSLPAMNQLTALLVTTAALLAPAVRAQAPVPQNGEFVVSTSGGRPDVAMTTSGEFVTVWNEGPIKARSYHADGMPATGPFAVSEATEAQFLPAVATDGAGVTTVVWSDGRTAATRLVMRRFDAARMPLGPTVPFSASTGQNNQAYARVAANAAGEVVATWADGITLSFPGDVYARRVAPDGFFRTGDLAANTRRPYYQSHPDAAIDAAGNAVVVWQDDNRNVNTDPDQFDVLMQRYGPTGAAVGGETRVNTTLTGAQFYPAVAMNPGGTFTAVWLGAGPQGGGVILQHFDASGARRGGEVRVNVTPALSYRPGVVLGARGDAVVVWARADGRVVLRRIDRDGAAASGEVLVGTTALWAGPFGTLGPPDINVASNDAGALVVVWMGTDLGSYGQRFALAPVAGEALPEAPAALAVSVAPVPAGASGATVRYTLAAAGEARVTVVDALGREVAVLADGAAAAGAHDVRMATAGLPSGVYAVRVEAGGAVTVVRVPVVQ